ncbi:hypothetical protein F4820DRAFT_446384 [Hypoxylon rubiginosum]|uniref:Uncharacterized protein n=1 Tax=Hypoxylon rubiginosum TaxID=110542 RepID=A0ACB9Z5I9_9PEZI|nr:hypothetical protein F4820DRAFT_446384 [Hypoxylon rubiginosum]
MSCGHLLTHHTKRCERGQKKLCAQLSLEGPRVYLPDCCAECDPEFNMSKIKRQQINTHNKLVEQAYANQRSGSSGEVERLLERIRILTSTTNKAIGEAKHHTSAVDVEFPGVTEPRGTSKWVDGKCIWEEEEEWKLPSYQPDRRQMNQTTSAAVVKETPQISAPQRLRSTKKGYIGPPEEAHREQVKVTGPPRLRTNKPYSGPRENVATVENREPEQQAPEMKRRLRRTKKHAEGLRHYDNVTTDSGFNVNQKLDTKRQGDSSPGIDRNPRPLKQNYAVVKGEEKVDEDIWLQLAEMNIKGEDPPRRIKARITPE